MPDAAPRAGSQSAGSPPLPEDWESGGGEESSTSAAVEVVPAAKKRKVSVKKIAKAKGESKTVLSEPSPPPGMSLPELAAVASALAATNPLASSSTLPPSPPPSTHRHVHHHSSVQPASATSRSLSSLSLDDLLQFRNGFKSELEGMRQSISRMEELMGKGVEWLGVLDGAVDTFSSGHHHHHHHHHHIEPSIGKRKERAEGAITSIPLAEVKSRTDEDMVDFLQGLPDFEGAASLLRSKKTESEKPPVVALVPADVEMVDADEKNT